MKALVISNVGETDIVQLDTPIHGPEEVLLSVEYVGLCGSDLNTYSGLNPLVQLPRIPGHEIGGTILEVGQDVPSNFRAGAAAIVIPYTACGNCSACKANRQNACRYNQTLGVQQDGGMSSLLVTHHDRLILNDSLSLKHLALVEPLSVGFHAVERGRVTSDDLVVVIGGGMIGVGAILGAIAKGASVIAVEISEAKRQALHEFGAEAVINPTETDLVAEIDKLTKDLGADVVIEAVGLPETFRSAVDLAGFAGRVVYIGYAKNEVSYNTSLFNLKELDIMGSRNATKKDFETVIEFLENNAETGDRLISRIFDWSEVQHSFEYWDDNRSTTFKVMISMDAD